MQIDLLALRWHYVPCIASRLFSYQHTRMKLELRINLEGRVCPIRGQMAPFDLLCQDTVAKLHFGAAIIAFE